ncbi:MAG: 2OG-Fe(II) oxygenase [Gammaproteobacteria bacterium]
MLDVATAIRLPDPYEKITTDLQQQGWCVCANFLSAEVVTALRQEALSQWQQGEFTPAGVGRGADRVVNTAIRSDKVNWLVAADGTAAQRVYWQAMEQLRLLLNRQLYLGLVDYEAHVSIYLPGDRYHRHVDQFRGSGRRAVSAILYLNNDWQTESGGELLLYTDMHSQTALQRIYPVAGQLVVFLSADFPHEVLPATRQRLSITGWYRTRSLASMW